MKSNSVVFNSFLSLLMGNLSKEEIYNDRNFDIWLCSKGRSFSGNNYPNYTLSSYYTEDNITYLFNLGSLKTETVYSEDGLPSSGCYQMAENGFLNIPYVQKIVRQSFISLLMKRLLKKTDSA